MIEGYIEFLFAVFLTLTTAVFGLLVVAVFMKVFE